MKFYKKKQLSVVNKIVKFPLTFFSKIYSNDIKNKDFRKYFLQYKI